MIRQVSAAYFDTISGFGEFQTGGDDPAGTLDLFFTNLLGVFTIIGGITFLIYFMLGAFNMLTSAGEKEKVAKAQGYISNALIGLIVIVLAWAITGILGELLGFDILNLEGLIGSLTGGSE